MSLDRRSRATSIAFLLIILSAMLPWQSAQAVDVVATVIGSFQKALGCSDDWQPQCDVSLMADEDDDGIFTFTIAPGAVPSGDYEYKVALNRSGDQAYPDSNQRFTIENDNAGVVFFFDTATNDVRHQSTEATQPAQDDNIFVDGLAHDSRDTLYRTPLGAQPADSLVTLRFRTFRDDVERVSVRVYHSGLQAEALHPMERVARNVDCYTPNLPYVCDFWQTTINVSQIGTLYYRFIAQDGSKTVFYEDDSDVRDGGWGAAYDESPDRGWSISVYDPDFALPIQWMKEAVVYQIVPDRFRNGDPSNDPTPDADNPQLSTDPRYAYPNGEEATASDPAYDQIVRMPWGDHPEGYCRTYAEIDPAGCPQRFTQPGDGVEEPRGRDYYGGDLQGVTEKLDYLQGLGVTVIYFNPIFDAASNHRYDTRDHTIVDRYLGELGDWETLVREAEARGMRVILDGVFNAMSADSPIFDRYGNHGEQPAASVPSTMPPQSYLPLATADGAASVVTGACESVDSPYRDWFRMRLPREGEPAACNPRTSEGASYYDTLAGSDNVPQLTESDPVRNYVYGTDQSVAQYWIEMGASGWQLHAMQDKSMPFWQEFRKRVKEVDPEAIVVGDLWTKLDILPYMTGATVDTVKNYRLRDAVLGLVAPQTFDANGFPGSGDPIAPSAFADRLESIREDYPDAAYFALLNVLGSHDTERLLWTLTPGAAHPGERERDADNLAEGKRRQRVAALIQMTVPGAPTIYYGDEVGLTGGGEPDNRRTYPWGDVEGDDRQPDAEMLAFYTSLTTLRREHPALINGDLNVLLADDAAGTIAYGRRWENDAAIMVINSSEADREVKVPVAGYLPDGTVMKRAAGCAADGSNVTVEGGTLTVAVNGLCGVVLTAVDADLTPPAAPSSLQAVADDLMVHLSWAAVEGAASYAIYRSPVMDGGYVQIKQVDAEATKYLDVNEELTSGQQYYYVVKALDAKGNHSAPSPEASAVPAYAIARAGLDRPATVRYTLSARETTETVYGQVYIEGVTGQEGPTLGLIAQIGYGPQNTDPREWTDWTAMEFTADAGNNDEFEAVLQPTTAGTYSYLARFSTDGANWIYADLDGVGDRSFEQQTNAPGTLEVLLHADETPPAAPATLQAINNGAASVRLTWTAQDDPTLLRYDIYRSVAPGTGYLKVGEVKSDGTSFTDTGLPTGVRHYYIVRAIDEANNVSDPSAEASAVPQPIPVEVSFEVSVPEDTPADRAVYIVGNQPELCDWCDAHVVALAKGDDGKWRLTITVQEGTTLEYNFTLGTWNSRELDATCGDVVYRHVRIESGENATQTIENAVANWRSVAPCGT